jgi:hypothetical protein
MKRWLAMLAGASIAVSASVLAATPEQEKQFVDTYRKAYDAKDAKTLNAMLYTKGADSQAVGSTR